MKIAIPVNLEDVKESKPVPAGKYQLTVASVDETVTKAGAPQLKVSIGIDGHDDAPNLTHFVSIPSAGDEKAAIKALFLTRFLSAFKIPYDSSGFDLDDFPGAVANCEVALSEPDENGNVYNRLNLPRLPNEASTGASAHRAPPPKR